MAIYEEFIGTNRDGFASYQDLRDRYAIRHGDRFNFAYDVLDVLAARTPDKLSMVWVGADHTEKFITFGEMSRRSNQAAHFFKSLGIKKGDRVLLVLKRSYLFWYCMMGLHKIGAVAVQATHLLTAKDYIYRCNSAGIKMAVITGDGDCAAQFDKGQPYETVKLKAVTRGVPRGDGWIDFEAGLYAQPEEWERPTSDGSSDDATRASDRMLLSFSSGTTGYPKMVCHDYTYPLGHLMTGIFWQRVVDGGLHFTISDTGWLKSLWGKMYGQWLGETAIFTYDFDRFVAADILACLEKYKVSTFCAPPTMLRMLVNEDMSRYDLSALKHCCTAGEALNPDTFQKWKDFTGLSIHEGFGQTETTLTVGTIYPYVSPKPGSMGLPAPGYDLVVTDEKGNEAPAGVTGEICVRATRNTRPVGLFTGYYQNEKETEAAFAENLYHSGDTAYRDESGYLWYVGRNDDIIKSSGYRIGPFEVESVLAEHPAVLEAAVTGVPDPVRGFNVKASIVLRKNFEPSPAMAKELQTYVKTHTAPYKYPRIIEFVAELPKTISGKIRRTEIREKDKENADA